MIFCPFLFKQISCTIISMATYPFDVPRLIDICRKNDVSMVGVFGLVARGVAKKKSDIDLIIRFSKRKSLLSLVRLERELSEALGRKVDLLTEAAISPYLCKRILKEMQVVYEKKITSLIFDIFLMLSGQSKGIWTGSVRRNSRPKVCFKMGLFDKLKSSANPSGMFQKIFERPIPKFPDKILPEYATNSSTMTLALTWIRFG